MKLVKLAGAASIVAIAGHANAATQGDLDSTSTGTADVIIVKDEAVQISDVDDFDFNAAAGGGVLAAMTVDPVITDAVCVFSSTVSYDVEVTSANGFLMTSPAGTTPINYDVSWGGTPVNETTVTPIAGIGNSLVPNCGGTGAGVGYAEVAVTLSSADFNAAAPGAYSDLLTMVVSPQ